MHSFLKKLIPTALVVIVLDQLSKAYLLTHPDLYRTGKFFELFLTTNEGIAFSIPIKGTALYVLILVLVTGGIYYSRKHFDLSSPMTGIVLGLIAGGGLGNLIDRFRFSHVIDFIKIGSWPMFNLADASITIAVLLLMFWRHEILVEPIQKLNKASLSDD